MAYIKKGYGDRSNRNRNRKLERDFYSGMNANEVAAKYQITRTRVYQIIKKLNGSADRSKKSPLPAD